MSDNKTPGQAARAKCDELAMKRSKDLRWYTTEQLREHAAADWEEIAQAAVLARRQARHEGLRHWVVECIPRRKRKWRCWDSRHYFDVEECRTAYPCIPLGVREWRFRNTITNEVVMP